MGKLDSGYGGKDKDNKPSPTSTKTSNTNKPAVTSTRKGDTFTATSTKNTGGTKESYSAPSTPSTKISRSGGGGSGEKSSYSVDSGIGSAVRSIDAARGIDAVKNTYGTPNNAEGARQSFRADMYESILNAPDRYVTPNNMEGGRQSFRADMYESMLPKTGLPDDQGMGMAVVGAPDDFLTHAPPGPNVIQAFIDDLMQHNQTNVAKRRAAGEPVWDVSTGFGGIADALVQTPAPGDKSMGILDAFDAVANPNRAPDGTITPPGTSVFTPPQIQEQLEQLTPERKGLPDLSRLEPEDQVRYLQTQLTPEQAASLPTNLGKFTPEQQAKYLISVLTPGVDDYLTNPAAGQPDVVGKDLAQLDPGPVGDVADMAAAEQMGGIDLPPLPRPRPDNFPPLPRPRPEHVVLPEGTPAAMGGAQDEDIWGSLRNGVPAGEPDPTMLMGDASDAASIGTAEVKEPSVMDNVVDFGERIFGNTLMGATAKFLLPDLWSGTVDALKGLDDNFKFGSGSRGADPMLRNSQGEDTEAERAFRFKQEYAVNGGGLPAAGVPPGLMPDPFPFPDTNKNGIDDRLEPSPGGAAPGGNVRTVGFPSVRYRPGVDDEYRYFAGRQFSPTIVHRSDGGLVQYLAEGGDVGALARQDPRVAVIADAEDALEGHAEEPEKAIKAFVDMFGEEALAQLAAQVNEEGLSLRRPGRLIEGKGGPKDDAIPAKIDNVQEARLSDGEFVMPADAVLGAGDGDRAQGAAALQELSERLAGAKQGAKALNVERVA